MSTARTRLVHDVESESVGRLVAAADRDVSIGGPTLAAHPFRGELIDEVQQFLNPVVVGGGTPFLLDDVLLGLDLLDVRRFDCGVVYLRYRTRR
ncbi:MAG: dihydrofolate reductase family protein [Nocardioides sp.]